jgi:hypothetical protein
MLAAVEVRLEAVQLVLVEQAVVEEVVQEHLINQMEAFLLLQHQRSLEEKT